VHEFVSSRLHGLLQQFVVRCQRRLAEEAADTTQRSSACCDRSQKVRSHLTSPMLRELHWLPVRHRITYKLTTIVYKCLHGLAPPYLADDWVPVTAGADCQRSADSPCLVVPRTRTVLGTCNFVVAGPLVWNSLPANIRSASVSLQTSTGRLKTCLFELPGAHLRTV